MNILSSSNLNKKIPPLRKIEPLATKYYEKGMMKNAAGYNGGGASNNLFGRKNKSVCGLMNQQEIKKDEQVMMKVKPRGIDEKNMRV